MNSKNHKGFTLLEVIFSMMLLGILGSSIFVAQASILRSLLVSHNKVSTCLFMHNALVLFDIQSNFSKKDLPVSLQDALGVLKIKKDPTNKENFSGQKLCNLIITQEQSLAAYSNEQQFSYFYYDATPKDKKNGST